MSDQPVTTGLYLSPNMILKNPAYLETLKREIGLNLALINFTGELSDEVMKANPFDGSPPSDARIRSLLSHHIDGELCTQKLDSARSSIGPHVSPVFDEDGLREAIRQVHNLEIKVWLVGGGWTSSDFDVLMYCPGKDAVNTWYETLYVHMAKSYGVDGVDITHARYPMTSYPRGLFLCSCEDCAIAAGDLGYDMSSMVSDIHHSAQRLRTLDKDLLLEIARTKPGLWDLIQILGLRRGVLDWFCFRADLLRGNLIRFRNAVHAAAGKDFIFGTDTYPASLGMFVGHNQAAWSDFSDFASPLLSHVDIFPMMTLTKWAQFLMQNVSGISESAALEIIGQLVGYGSLEMPKTIGGYALGEPDCEFRNVPLEELVGLDMLKAKLFLPVETPSYPIIQGGGAPHEWPLEMVNRLKSLALDLGHNGVIYQGTSVLVDFEFR
ncbi:MAG: hypothetical protein CME25_10370 [Gemmatimonadetes bacterium]|nr:hypothetical protein [Gemmatimonadota bacterium]|tara:strand:- start:3414 stop:4724 length:1311 start_codon:yes stop_codon:yes gene_type:complete